MIECPNLRFKFVRVVGLGLCDEWLILKLFFHPAAFLPPCSCYGFVVTAASSHSRCEVDEEDRDNDGAV